VPDTRKQGVYRRGNADSAIALNLLSSRGAKPWAVMAPTNGDEEVSSRADARRGVFGLPLRITWGWILLAAAGAGLMEWVLFHRRVVRIG
jgi:hypothetical protein